jgi:rubrerythrin
MVDPKRPADGGQQRMQADAALIREILARECDTVNLYEQMADRASDATTRTLILHLAREEKEHIAECARFLARLDADYAAYLEKPLGHAIDGEDAPAASPVEAAAPPRPPAALGAAAWQGHFTIGSLMQRPTAEKK